MPLSESATKQVLIVEDEGLIAMDIQTRLESFGCSAPTTARSCQETQPIKAETDIPLIYLAALADRDMIRRARLTEPHGCLLKPVRTVDLPNVFEPLITGGNGEIGRSLALSVAHSIVTQAGGSIRVTSAAGQGTMFETLLPRVQRFRTATEEVSPEQIDGPGDAPPTILLVEDNDAVRGIIHKHFERQGFHLLEARNAEEARDLIKVYEGPVHALVTDVVMPGLSGPDLAKELVSVRPGLKVLLISGFPQDSLQQEATGADWGFLQKPFSSAELLAATGRLLRGNGAA